VSWDHISPIHGHAMGADIDCSSLKYPAKFIVGGDFDSDGLTEVVAAPAAPGSRGNDLWVMKYNIAAARWQHMAPIPDHPMDADIDCSGRRFPAKFIIVADFDGDGADELMVAPDAAGSRGNDLWLMKFDQVYGAWQHMAPIPGHAMDADIDCSGLQFAAKFAYAADFDGDGRAELVVAPNVSGTRGNDLWVMKYVGAFPNGAWQHMAPIPGHAMEADIDCSGLQFAAKFAYASDFDGDGHAELVIVPDAAGSRGNDLWVLKYVGRFPDGVWQHMAPIPNHPMEADIDCSSRRFPAKLVVGGDFDHDERTELVIAPDAAGSRGNDLWVMKYIGDFPNGAWHHMAPIPGHAMDADIDCSGRQFPAKFTVVADLDGDLRDELVVAPAASGSRGNDLWVMKYIGDFPNGTWQHMAPILGHAMDADIDCSGTQFPAKFAVAADFDRDGADELVIAPETGGSDGNNLWVMKYSGSFPSGSFVHMTPIPGSKMDADIDCSAREFPAKAVVVGVFDGEAPELMVAPDTGSSRGNDFWVVGLKAQTVEVVNMIPNSLSGESNQDSEPNIAVNPANPDQIAASAFTPNPGGPTTTTAPIFVSSDGGATWVLNNIVPSQQSTHDITLRFATLSGNLYAGILRAGAMVDGTRDILRTNNYLGPALMTLLTTQDHLDQPYVEAASVDSPASAPPIDRVWVGNEDRARFGPVLGGTGTGQTAVVDLSQNATATPPSGFTQVPIEQRVTRRNGPPVRPAVHPDGTIYVLTYRWTAFNGGIATVDVIVARDDQWGASAQPFHALIDPGDNTAGMRVVTQRSLPFDPNLAQLGQERLVGSNLSIAIDPRDSSVVFIAWADRVGANDYTLHVRRSADSGATWSEDLRTVTNATNPALAVNSVGKVAFLYQALTGSAPNERWDTHLELTTDDWASAPGDFLLATVPAATPVRVNFPYIGDYVHIMAVERTFYGVFAANNRPDSANFPNGVTYQRNANFNTHILFDLNNATPVNISIDPFFFKIVPSRPRQR
jgi:FG-GAP-like repeat